MRSIPRYVQLSLEPQIGGKMGAAIGPKVEREKNSDIEILRAYAILITLTAHNRQVLGYSNFWAWLANYARFSTGVDLFFCISGFVIASSLARYDLTNPRLFLLQFWLRRIFRIWPAACLSIATILVLSFAYNRSGIFGSPLRNLIDAGSFGLQMSNLWFGACDIFHAISCGRADFFYSLSLEEQFYFLYPLALIFLSSRTRRWTLAALVVGQFFIPRGMGSSFLWWVRTDAICLGILLADWARENRSPQLALLGDSRCVFGAITGSLLAALCVFAAPITPLHTGIAALISALLVLLASADRGLICAFGMRPFLLWLGTRSYSIYLFQLPLFWMVDEALFRAGIVPARQGVLVQLVIMLGALSITAIVAEFIYRLVESPFRKFGRKKARELIRLTDRDAGAPAPSSAPHIIGLLRSGRQWRSRS